MVPVPSRLSKTASLSSTHTSASAARKRQSRQSLRYSASLQIRRGHDKLESLDTNKAHVGNNSGRILDQVASSFSSSISGPGGATSVANSYIRRELWQERTPTSLSFPHIQAQPPRRRHVAARGGIRARSARIKRGLSLTFYSYSRLPFFTTRNWRLRLDRAKVRTSIIAPKPEKQRKRSMATIQISEPWSSAGAASRADLEPPMRKTSLPFKSANPSPLGCHPVTTLAEPVPAVSIPKPAASTPQQTSFSPPPPVPIRHPSRHRKRDSFNRAKIHIRRPPKGTVHWFDAIDDVSDDDYAETAEEASQKSPRTNSSASAFQPSLGPNRLRAAPTSRITGSDMNPDYFNFRETILRKHLAPGSRSPTIRRRKNRESQLTEGSSLRFIAEKRLGDSGDVSSDEDDQQQKSSSWSAKYFDLATPSPSAMGQVYLRRAASRRKASINTHTARQSGSSAQTSATSASLPFMLRVMPTFEGAPPLPDTPPATTPDCLPISYFALTGRLPGSGSGAVSPISDAQLSAVPSSEGISASLRKGSILSSPPLSATSRLMAVTEEEMKLLEAMRRKRTMMQDEQALSAQSSAFSSPTHAPQLMPLPLRPLKKKNDAATDSRPQTRSAEASVTSERKASASSTITLEDGENIEFPTPPTNDSRPASKGSRQSSRKSSLVRSRLVIPGTTVEDSGEFLSTDTYLAPTRRSHWSPEIQTPAVELEANPFERPATGKFTEERPSTSHSTRWQQLFANRAAAKPIIRKEVPTVGPSFSVEFGDLHLAPLSHSGCDDSLHCQHNKDDLETISIALSEHDNHDDAISNGSASPGLTDGDTSSCGRTSRNEAETPNKNCTFTANAFEIVDSSDDDLDRHHIASSSSGNQTPLTPATPSRYARKLLKRTKTPLLGKANNMYAFAESRDIVATSPSESSAETQQTGQIDIGVMSAFHTLSGGYTAIR